MSKILEKLETFRGYLKTPNLDSLEMSLADVHSPGLFSLVIAGTEPGKLTRVFIATEDIDQYSVQLHSHRYPIKLTALKGTIGHTHVEDQIIGIHEHGRTVPGYMLMSRFTYKSPLNGGAGLAFDADVQVQTKEYVLPVGSMVYMDEKHVHTVCCLAGAIWVVEEQGFKTDESTVLGVPFTVDGLYNKPQQFQINDMCQTVLRQLNYLINQYKSV